MSNIYKGLGVVYFQVPDGVVNGELLATLSGTAWRLYLLILQKAQQKSSPVVKLTTQGIVDATGMNRRFVYRAASELNTHGLVSLVQHKGIKWSYEFQILDYETGLPIPTHYERTKLDAGKLTREQVQDYFLHRLGRNFDHFDDNGIRAHCPFHFSPKKQPTLHIKTHSQGAAWKCHEEKCPQWSGGSIIDFEFAILALQGKQIDTTQAWERIVFIIRGAERKQAVERNALQKILEDPAYIA